MSTKSYIDSFALKLERISPEKISGQDYCRKYLRHLIDHRKYYLEIYSTVLDKLCKASGKKKETITLIDFGAGNGLLGMFAKHCGFKAVFLNDIDKSFIKGSISLAHELGITISAFIHGDVKVLPGFFTNEIPDAIAGTDVIEHIYDLNVFFSTLAGINPKMVSVFTTASNPENYFKVQQLKKLQLKDELVGGEPGDFVLFGHEGHESFFKIRKDIIKSHTSIGEEEADRLSKATRGYNKEDIIKAVNKYIETNELPIPPSHPTNTCNPLNSSWTERILSLDKYDRIYTRHGFSLEVYTGFYDQYKPGLKKYFNPIMNGLVKILGKKIAPFIILVGSHRTAPQSNLPD